ncbi:MAG: hypothetical protein AAB309_00110 [Deltaproteobacteria bacterium]
MRVFLLFFLIFLPHCAPALHNIISNAEVLAKLNHNGEKISSFRGMGRVSFRLSQKEGAVEVLIVADKKGNLRLETGNFFGVPLSAMTIQNQKLAYYVISEEKFYIGEPSEKIVSSVLPLQIEERDLRGLIFFSKETVEGFKKKKSFKLDIFKCRYEEKQNLFYPIGFRLTDEKTGEYLQINWEEYDLNPSPFPAKIFRLERPPQARLMVWGTTEKHSPLLKGYDEIE